jgi:hypothetical protein
MRYRKTGKGVGAFNSLMDSLLFVKVAQGGGLGGLGLSTWVSSATNIF